MTNAAHEAFIEKIQYAQSTCGQATAEGGSSTRATPTRKQQQGTTVLQAPDTTQGPSPQGPPTRRRAHKLSRIRARDVRSRPADGNSITPGPLAHQELKHSARKASRYHPKPRAIHAARQGMARHRNTTMSAKLLTKCSQSRLRVEATSKRPYLPRFTTAEIWNRTCNHRHQDAAPPSSCIGWA